MANKPTPPKPCAPDSMGNETPSATMSRWAPPQALPEDAYSRSVEAQMQKRRDGLRARGAKNGKVYEDQGDGT